MATRLKTVAFPFPNLASMTDNTTTNFTQITVDLPESSKTFRKVWVDFMANDIVTVTGGTVNIRGLGCRVGAAAYTTVTNSNAITNSGENISVFISQDFTSHFTTNWSGTSMTCDVQALVDQSTGTTLGQAGASAILWVTYEYDDTSTTQVMNAWIPMTSAVGALPTSKGTAQDTVPNLDTFLGYGSISYKHIMMIMEGNESNAAGTTTFQVSVQLDTTTTQVSSNLVAALASDRYGRQHFNLMSGGSPIFTTNATHSFYSWISTGAVTRMNHAAFTMLVTFTFDSTSANAGNVSLLLPMEIDSPAGGTTSSDYQKGYRELWIQEGATITTQKSAYRLMWDQIGAVSGINARAGTQSFVAYTDTAAVLCGSNCLQRTCDDNITFAGGRNTLSFDVYRTDTTNLMWNLSGFWIINYRCAKPTDGWGAANHTVIWNLLQHSTTAAAAGFEIAATSVAIPETNYFIVGLGAEITNFAAAPPVGYNIVVERLSGEGGVKWENVYRDHSHTDAEIGLRKMFAQMRTIFKRYPTDVEVGRIDLETNRRWKIQTPANVACYYTLNVMLTYHSITATVSGTISNSNGGTVNLYLHKGDSLSVSNTGEIMQSSSRSGNGAYSFTHYDALEIVYVRAYENATYKGVSKEAVAATDFDISLSGGGSPGATNYAFSG